MAEWLAQKVRYKGEIRDQRGKEMQPEMRKRNVRYARIIKDDMNMRLYTVCNMTGFVSVLKFKVTPAS